MNKLVESTFLQFAAIRGKIMRILLFLLLLPFLAAVGHDVYINFFSDDEKIRQVKRLDIDPEDFLISDLGWVMQEHAPGTYMTMRDMVGDESWREFVDPVLAMPTMVVAAIPFLVAAVLAVLIYLVTNRAIFQVGGWKRSKNADFSVYKHAKSNSMKFKRK
jgi:hypothetical protein